MSRPNGSGIPMLALDVDGVLSPLTKDVQPTPAHTRHIYEGRKADGSPIAYPVWLDVTDGAWLNGLIGMGVEIVWATSWVGAANTFIAPIIGLEHELRVLPMEPKTYLMFGWTSKYPLVHEAAEGRPLCWVDDLFGGKERGWAAQRTRAGLHTTIIHTTAHLGLTGRDRAQIHRWAATSVGV